MKEGNKFNLEAMKPAGVMKGREGGTEDWKFLLCSLLSEMRKKWRLGFFCFARYLSASLFYLEEQRVLADEDLYFSRRS